MNIVSVSVSQHGVAPDILDRAKELSDIVLSKVDNLTHNVSSNVKFSIDKECSTDTVLPETLVEITQRVRSRIPYNVYLRGTTLNYQQQALQAGVISGKQVDSWYENDVGDIATYKIPMGASSLSNEEFLARLCLTMTSSVGYALSHALYSRERLSLILFAPKHLTQAMSWDIHYASQSNYFPNIARDTGYEDVSIGGRRFPVFPENSSGTAFSRESQKNNHLVIGLPEFSRDFSLKRDFPAIEPLIALVDKKDEFKYSIALMATIILLQELPKFIAPIQELRGV